MIPKVIYMCHKNLATIQQYSQNWKRLNPEYEIKLYDNAMCEQFLLQEFSPLHCAIFKFIRDGPIKADFWRLCILYKYGGLYVDADIEPLVPLREYIEEGVGFVTCLSAFRMEAFGGGSDNFNPHFIMAQQNDAILKACIIQYMHFYVRRKPYTYMGWTIVKIFNRFLPFIKNPNITTLNQANKKYQVIIETSDRTDKFNYYCKYKNRRVFNCRYKEYDGNAHGFKSEQPLRKRVLARRRPVQRKVTMLL